MELLNFTFISSCILGYIIGSFQSSYILGRIFNKIDIREHGTHNAGASNATMILGFKLGFITFVLDIYKVVLAMALVNIFFDAGKLNYYYAGLSAILGHNFPFYLKFKGGKGVASFIGFFVGIDSSLGFIMILFLSCFAIITNYISITGIFLYFIGPILVWKSSLNIEITIYSIVICFIGIYLHRENIIKIRDGKEKKLREFILDKILKRDN
ncbi:MAG: acyl-phosphate glycerol 3-phosphate acyltransferase [Candidatus Marinimicrobia bacterium]|nr:acyl-phosphate glycerol 3-phosphate acyltransferase [Candidatus Neomarinimicrobiota bacterium]|tara:strand:+ start:1393 stop:2028 length:636 start_codon:yes stop_codon:yes gene_type:complete